MAYGVNKIFQTSISPAIWRGLKNMGLMHLLLLNILAIYCCFHFLHLLFKIFEKSWKHGCKWNLIEVTWIEDPKIYQPKPIIFRGINIGSGLLHWYEVSLASYECIPPNKCVYIQWWVGIVNSHLFNDHLFSNEVFAWWVCTKRQLFVGIR